MSRSTGHADDSEDLVTAVLTASRVLVAISARSVAEIEDKVTMTQFRTLVVLDAHGRTNLNGVARELGVNASTALRTVDRLIAAGLVTRHENQEDRREVVLAATPAGRRLVHRVTERRRRDIAAITARMSPSRRSGLVRALQAFTDAAGEPPVPPTADSVTW